MRQLSVLALISFVIAAPRVVHADACSPPRVMVILDKSSSMQTGTIDGATKWTIARDVLDPVLLDLEGRAEVGLMTFPEPDACGPGALDVAPAFGTHDAILDALATAPPAAGNWTPMAETLEAAALEPTLVGVDAPRYAVLVTDGWQWCYPYDDATRFDGVAAIDALNAAGVTTFVVGFGGATDAIALDRMAIEAGTARVGCHPGDQAPSDPPCFFQADDADALFAALAEISDQVSAEVCDGRDNDCDGQVDEDACPPLALDPPPDAATDPAAYPEGCGCTAGHAGEGGALLVLAVVVTLCRRSRLGRRCPR